MVHYTGEFDIANTDDFGSYTPCPHRFLTEILFVISAHYFLLPTNWGRDQSKYSSYQPYLGKRIFWERHAQST
jgi:hypothetical protein